MVDKKTIFAYILEELLSDEKFNSLRSLFEKADNSLLDIVDLVLDVVSLYNEVSQALTYITEKVSGGNRGVSLGEEDYQAISIRVCSRILMDSGK